MSETLESNLAPSDMGGFAVILAEYLDIFAYTGLDVNGKMVRLARERPSRYVFHQGTEAEYAVPRDETSDGVLVLDIAHLYESWLETSEGNGGHTRGALIFDLRQIAASSVEDPERSDMKMVFGGAAANNSACVPYDLVNVAEAQALAQSVRADARSIAYYGCRQP